MVLKHSKDYNALEFLCFSFILGVGDDCYDAGPADSDYDCASTCVNLEYPGYNYCTDSQECFCGTPGDYCPCP